MPFDEALVKQFVEKINEQRVAGITLDSVKAGQKFVLVPKLEEINKKEEDRPTVLFKGIDNTGGGAYNLLLGAAASIRILNSNSEPTDQKGALKTAIQDVMKLGKVDETAYDQLNMDEVLVTLNLPAYNVMNLQSFGRALEEGVTVLNFEYECIGHCYIRNLSRPTELVYQPFCYEKAEKFYSQRAEIDWEERDVAIRTLTKIRSELHKEKLIPEMATYANLQRIPIFDPTAISE